MNSILTKKIEFIYSKKPDKFANLEILIECPLDFSVSVTGEWSNGDEKAYLQMDDAWEFLKYVDECRTNEPDRLFNRITICVQNGQITDMLFVFDENLQKQTMEDLK